MTLPRPVRHVVSRWTLVVGCLALLVSCGLSTNESPERLSRENLPADLGGPEATFVPLPEGTAGEPVELWFLVTSGDGHLEPITREVPPRPTPGIVLETLFTFPRDEFGDRPMRTAIPPETRVTEEPRIDDDGVLVLELSETFYEDLPVEDPPFAFGQIVLTMASRFDISAVQFMEGNDRAPVTVGNGTERDDGLVEPQDYTNLKLSAN